MADSQALFTDDSSQVCAPQVTPDGRTVICPSQADSAGAAAGSADCAYGALRFTAFPLPDEPSGPPARILYEYPGTCHDAQAGLLWTNASGSSIIGRMTIAKEAGKETSQVGVITGGRFRPLNIAKSTGADAYLVF